MKVYVWYDGLTKLIYVSHLDPEKPENDFDKLEKESFSVVVPVGITYNSVAQPICNVLRKCGAEVIYSAQID